MFYLLKKEKRYCFIPAKGTFHCSTYFCITVQAPKAKIKKSVLFLQTSFSDLGDHIF